MKSQTRENYARIAWIQIVPLNMWEEKSIKVLTNKIRDEEEYIFRIGLLRSQVNGIF